MVAVPTGPAHQAGPRPQRHEPLSPFVTFDDVTLESLDDAHDQARAPSLWVDLLRDPEAAVARMLDPSALQSAIVGSLLTVAICTGAFAFIVRFDEGALKAASGALWLAGSTLLAVAAALGPIHATSLLVAARVPMARLVAVLLGAVAAGAVVLAPLAPIVRLLHQRDEIWLGPISLVSAFAVSGLVAGTAVNALLHALAVASGPSALSDSDEFRVGILARMAMVFLGFTVALAWGMGAFQ